MMRKELTACSYCIARCTVESFAHGRLRLVGDFEGFLGAPIFLRFLLSHEGLFVAEAFEQVAPCRQQLCILDSPLP